MLKKLIAVFGKIDSNLNQIVHHYNGDRARSVAMYERTMRAISELYAMKYEVERMGGEFFRGYSQTHFRTKQRLRGVQYDNTKIAYTNYYASKYTIFPILYLQ